MFHKIRVFLGISFFVSLVLVSVMYLMVFEALIPTRSSYSYFLVITIFSHIFIIVGLVYIAWLCVKSGFNNHKGDNEAKHSTHSKIPHSLTRGGWGLLFILLACVPLYFGYGHSTALAEGIKEYQGGCVLQYDSDIPVGNNRYIGWSFTIVLDNGDKIDVPAIVYEEIESTSVVGKSGPECSKSIHQEYLPHGRPFREHMYLGYKS
ncbi:MAG: hypothetical protein ACOCXT_04110 [Candidatus Dojkabacteria bacterium]